MAVSKKSKKSNFEERFYPELKPEQESAVIMIVRSGFSLKDTAEKLNKTHHVVYKWMKDEGFRQALEQEKQKLHEELIHKYASLPEKAYNAIQMNLMSENPDVKVALQFLEKTGNLVKTNEKSDADEKTRRMAQALVAELSAMSEED